MAEEHTAKPELYVRIETGFKGRIDPNVVWNEMMRVIRHAVNALPPEQFYVRRKI